MPSVEGGAVLFKVQFPSGSLKKSATVNLRGELSVQAALAEIIKTGKLAQDQLYFLYLAEATPRRWLHHQTTLAELGLTPNSTVFVKRRWQIIKTRLVMGTSTFVQGLICDVREPLAAFVPYAARKFQAEAVVEFALYKSKTEPLPLDKSFFDLDLPVDVQLVLASKTQTIPDSAFNFAPDTGSGNNPTMSPAQSRPAAVSVAGTVTFDKKKRYLSLEGSNLTVFKESKDSSEKPLQTIDLTDFVIQADDKDKKKLQFDLVHSRNRKDTHQFKLDTEAEFQQWFPSLEAVLGSASSGAANARDNAPPDPSLKVFGASLAQMCGSEPTKIPYIVQHCIQYVDEKALDTEGIFRLSGSQVQIDRYRDQFNQGIRVDLTNEIDPHTVAGLLKLFFREMPEPLLTFELYESFIAAQAERDSVKRIRYLRHLLTLLPVANRATLKYLIAFLSRVEKHSAVNKMAMHNLATVFGPNLLSLKDGDVLRLVEDTPFVNGLVNTFIKDFDLIFSDEEPPEVSPLLAQAMYDFAATSDKELSFKVGDMIKVHKQGDENSWWYGELHGKLGMFPGAYVRVQSQSAQSKRDKFIQEMNNVRNKIAEEKKQIEELEAKRLRLQNDIEKLKHVKELAASESQQLKQRVAATIRSNPELASFPSKLEAMFAQLESYHKTRTAMLSSKQTLVQELGEFKKVLQSDSKYKKIKDKAWPLIEALIAKLDEEQAARAIVDEKKDHVMKDLSELRVVVGKSS